MQLGVVGLGRMGANMVRRLLESGHQCIVYDRSAKAVEDLVAAKASGSSSVAEFIRLLTAPRAIWLMVPAGVVDASLAPGRGEIPRTPGREEIAGTAEQGYLHCGPNGAGHFVKMVHNGIEYGVMAAYAEGLGILHDANVGKQQHAIDAETTPLRDPEHYQYDLNLRDIAEVWRRGSVVASWLLDLTATALAKDASLSGFAGR